MMIEEGNDTLNQSLPTTTTMTPVQKKNKNKSGRELRRSVTCLEPATTERLQIVDLSNMSLNALPNPTLSLTSICKLDLSNNNLQNIPESLTARLLNLIVLDVRSNQLRTIPNSIGCLTKLKTLNVSGNFIESLPKTIENCRLLEELNANFNKLKRLPDTMGYELTNLKKLSVNSNKLIFLPNSITHMTSLRVLDARLNCLHSLPDDLENLINLEILNVSQNFQYLSSLPFSLGLLISLVELDISYNRITVLPHSLGCLRKLQKLSVEGNPLVSPPKEVMEQSLYSVKEYLSEKMNSAGNKSPSKKKGGWGGFGKLVKWRTFNAREGGREEAGEGYAMSDYRQIEGLASPRYMSALSPRRLFSPRRNYFSP